MSSRTYCRNHIETIEICLWIKKLKIHLKRPTSTLEINRALKNHRRKIILIILWSVAKKKEAKAV